MRAALAAGALAAALAALGSGVAHADDKAKAIALFDEGRKEMKAGNHAKACRAFEASMRLVRDSGTRGSLARCYTALGRVASAWTLWRELADTAPPALRADAAAEAKKLEPRLPRYRVKIAAPAPGLAVTVAGEPVDVTLDVAVPIDPGTYEVLASAPGREPWRDEVTATEGQMVVIDVPELVPPARAGEPPRPEPPRSGSRDPGRGRRVLGIAFAGAGLGGLAAGGVFGALARSRNEDAKALCGGAIDRCDPVRTNDAQAKVDDARSAATVATIAAIAGGAALVTGVVLYVTAPERERRAMAVTPVIGGGHAGLALSGRY